VVSQTRVNEERPPKMSTHTPVRSRLGPRFSCLARLSRVYTQRPASGRHDRASNRTPAPLFSRTAAGLRPASSTSGHRFAVLPVADRLTLLLLSQQHKVRVMFLTSGRQAHGGRWAAFSMLPPEAIESMQHHLGMHRRPFTRPVRSLWSHVRRPYGHVKNNAGDTARTSPSYIERSQQRDRVALWRAGLQTTRSLTANHGMPHVFFYAASTLQVSHHVSI